MNSEIECSCITIQLFTFTKFITKLIQYLLYTTTEIEHEGHSQLGEIE